MNTRVKTEEYAPNRRFDESLNAEGLARVIGSEVGYDVGLSGEGWIGELRTYSGWIEIGVYGDSREDIVVRMTYEKSVINREKRRVRRVFAEKGLAKC